jgi:Alcohol dehydrogenase GroES-like domain
VLPIKWRIVMRAIVLEKFGGLDSLVYKDIPEPEPKAGHVVIQIKAFGLNHAELHMRRGEWAEAAPVSGIECVGLVKSCPGGEFPVGAKVAALMGGLGRTINGSYAEYASCSELQASRSRTCPFNRLLRTPRRVGSTSSRPGYSDSTRSAKLTAPWRQTKPAAKWLSCTTDRRPHPEHDGATPQAALDYALRLSGTLPPLSASFVMTCFCSHTFIAAEPSSAPA